VFLFIINSKCEVSKTFYRTPWTGVKRPGPEADHATPSSAKVKDAWSYTRVYPKVYELAAWNCKWYSCLPLDAVISLFYESV